jgi:putative nucleotidyltransferase with HDIG domain
MVLIFTEWQKGNIDLKNGDFWVLTLFFILFESMAVNFQSFILNKFGENIESRIFVSTGVIISVLSAAILPPSLAMLLPLFGYLFLRIKILFSKNYYYFLFNVSSLGIIAFFTSFFIHFFFVKFGNSLLASTIFISAGSIIYFFLNLGFAITFLFASYQKISKEIVDIIIGQGKFLNSFSTAVNTLIVYVLYTYIGLFAIPLSLFTFLTIQLSNYYATKYRNSKIELLTALSKSIEEKDSYTAGHGEKVAEVAVKIAEKFGLPKKDVELLKTAGLLHDIGKIGIPEFIILKKGKLTDEEYNIMKEHPKKGFEILKQVNEFEDTVAKWVLYHHERWDGEGYPEGLKGEEIPIQARILTLADVYHALTSDRPYRAALSKEETVKIIQKESGKFFDPQLVEIILNLIREGKV